MTIKQYMKFEDFKREFLLEAKKGRFPVGIYWSFHKDPKDEENKKKGIVDFYIALDNKIDDKLKEKHNKAIDEIIKKIKGGSDSITFRNDSKEQIQHEFDKEYSLNRITIPFEFKSTLSEKEDLNKIKDFVKSTVKLSTQNIKVYTFSELTDPNSNKAFTERSDAQEKAIEYIDDMINHPEKFGGYKTVAQHLDEIKDMTTMEFVHKYASDGPLEALAAKLIFNGINKLRDMYKNSKDEKNRRNNQKANPPTWKTDFTGGTAIQNKKDQIDLAKYINNYDLNKNDIDIVVSPELPDEYTINGTVFEYQFKEQKEYSITFTLKSKSKKNNFSEVSQNIKINVTIPKWKSGQIVITDDNGTFNINMKDYIEYYDNYKDNITVKMINSKDLPSNMNIKQGPDNSFIIDYGFENSPTKSLALQFKMIAKGFKDQTKTITIKPK